MKRKKAILCALAGIGFITSAGTVKANAMTMKNDTNTTTKCIHKLKPYQVEDLLNTLPCYTISTDAKEQAKTMVKVIVGRMAYDSLTPDEQRRVDESSVYTLRHNEELLHRLLGDEAKALGLVCGILKVEDEVEYNQETRSINTENLKSNKKNTENIRQEIADIENCYQTLDYTIKTSPGLSHFMGELNNIELKLLQAKID